MEYPVQLVRDDNATWLVQFPDFPEAHTFGDTVDEALTRATDALATVMDAYVMSRRAIPAPSPIEEGRSVTVPALMEAKLALYNTARAARVNKAELARRLDVHPPQVDRLFDMHHASRLDQLEAAFQALGKRLQIAVTDVVPVAMAFDPVHDLMYGSSTPASAMRTRSARTSAPAARILAAKVTTRPVARRKVAAKKFG